MRDAAMTAGQWCAVASLFVVPINKPATNVALGLSVILSLVGSDLRGRWVSASQHPVVRGFLIWWCVLVLSAMHSWYSTGRLPLEGSFVWVCLYPLVLGSLLRTPMWRRRALIAFALAMTLVLLLSYGMDVGLVPQRAVVQTQPAMRNTVFKEYTQQGLAMLIFGSMAIAAALTQADRRPRLILFFIALLVLINIVFLVESRTAYVTLIPVAGYWIWRQWLRGRARWRYLVLATGLATSVAAAACFIPVVHQRLVASVTHDAELYATERKPSSTGIRLELWRRTLPIIASAPLFGHGLEQWAPLYQQSIEGRPNFTAFLMGHPHQEMLLILSEQGIAGLLIYLLLLAALARYIDKLDPPERDVYACLLLVYLTAGLANCLWADFSHRHLFVLLLACIPPATRMFSSEPKEFRSQ